MIRVTTISLDGSESVEEYATVWGAAVGMNARLSATQMGRMKRDVIPDLQREARAVPAEGKPGTNVVAVRM